MGIGSGILLFSNLLGIRASLCGCSLLCPLNILVSGLGWFGCGSGSTGS